VKITIELRDSLYQELLEAAKVTNCLGNSGHGISVTRFVEETLEAELAQRRLDKLG
jgi:hypothetical protein